MNLKNPILPVLFFAALFCFASCASQDKGSALAVYLTNSSKYILLPPSGIEKPMDMVQRISSSYQGRDFQFGIWVKAGETGMDMALFSDFGAGMGELSYRDAAVAFSSPAFPKSLKPEYIVADFQLCFYSAALVGKALEDCGLSLEVETGEQGAETRRVFQGKELIVEIEKNSSLIRFMNHLRGYAYTLEGDFR